MHAAWASKQPAAILFPFVMPRLADYQLRASDPSLAWPIGKVPSPRRSWIKKNSLEAFG
jgi:hypothetical protein